MRRILVCWRVRCVLVGADVIVDSALPLIVENSALNAHLWSRTDGADQLENVEERPEGSIGTTSNEIAIHSEVLDWDVPLPSWVHESPIDLIMYVPPPHSSVYR
jgi:hypothetical protein